MYLLCFESSLEVFDFERDLILHINELKPNENSIATFLFAGKRLSANVNIPLEKSSEEDSRVNVW